MDIQALLFDINGTLVDIETDERMEEAYRAIAHFLTYQGITLHRGEVLDLYFQVMKEQFDASKEQWPEFDVVAVWREILRRNGSRELEHLPLFIAQMQRGICRKRLCAFPHVPEVLAHLKKQYPLAIVSDAQTAYGIPELRLAGVAEYFDPIIISRDYGYRKPDPRLFQNALDELRVQPEHAIFVGNDRYRDVFGARQLGMKTVLFASGPCGRHPQDAEPDYIIYNFSELPTAVEFLAAR